jgi:hypothetical protein|tara:strand:- start:295 stop:918 length:624 start_codon:yes stop_codon:yes gene_type:complete
LSTIVTDAVTALSGNLALLPEGSGVVTIDGLTYPAADGSASQLMQTNGSGVLSFTDAPSSGWTLGTPVATTSGTTVTFGSLPSTIKMAVLLMDEVSLDGNVDFDVTIGDSGGLHTSSYVSVSKPSEMITSTAEFNIYNSNAGFNFTGAMTIMLQNASTFRYISTHVVSRGTNDVNKGTGVVTLDSVMTQISISGGTFDAGAVNLMYI